MIDPYDRYKVLSEEVDLIFSTSNVLQGLYTESLKELMKMVNVRVKQGQIKEDDIRPLQALLNVKKESIDKSEIQTRSRLYAQAIILLVSVSEQLLKEVFEEMFRAKFFQIKVLEKKKYEISYEEIVEKNGSFNVEDWQEKILTNLYGDRNPEEKINLQNVKTIEGVFKGYFEVNLDLDKNGLSAKLNYFYQIRHLLVHSAGKIDNKFIKNIQSANLGRDLKVGEKVETNKSDYVECRDLFEKFFKIISDKIDLKS